MRKNRLLLLTIVCFFLLDLIFHHRIVKEIFLPNPKTFSINDGVVTEFLTETEYQNVITGSNPFSPTDKLFYPFTTNFALNDTSAVNLIFLIFLRPFFSIHQATLLIVFFNFFLASVLMYLLLRRLSIDYLSSVLISLIYTFSPPLSYRILGHYTYTTHYFFPLISLSFVWLIEQKNPWKKNLLALMNGVLMAFFFFANPYYFIMLMVGLFFYGCYYLFFLRKRFFYSMRKNAVGIVIVSVSFLLMLLPWLIQVKQWWQFERSFEKSSLYRPIILSADLVNFIVPSEYNPFYAVVMGRLGQLSNHLSKFSYFFFYNWERFAYPGILIILVYIVILLYRRRLPKKLWRNIKLPFFTSLFFAILTLGPFLKIFNRWFITLDEGIKVYLPLPFLLIFYIPLLNIVSAPARFITAFVFFACLTAAFTMSHFLSKIRKHLSIPVFFSGLFLIFFIDQYYLIPEKPRVKLPAKIYQHIRQDSKETTVLEIPFVIRDGLRYRGYVHALSPMEGVLIHQKPIVGGYLSRVSPAVFQYYDNLPFISYLASIIDKGNFVLYKQEPQEPKVRPFTGDLNLVKEELDFLGIKYVLLKNGEKYTIVISEVLGKVGFSQRMKEVGFTLWERSISKNNFDQVKFGSANDFLYVGENLGPREGDFRWAQGQSAKIFFRINDSKKTKLHFEIVSFHEPQDVTIYINQRYVVTKNVPTVKQALTVDISKQIKRGINEVVFQFVESFAPAQILPNNQDRRNLAAQFFSLGVD